MDPIAYTYEASEHCPACTLKRFGYTWRVMNWDNPRGEHLHFIDEDKAREYADKHRFPVYGPFIAEDATDNEGNPVGAVFPWDEWDRSLVCGTCGEVIREVEEIEA